MSKQDVFYIAIVYIDPFDTVGLLIASLITVLKKKNTAINNILKLLSIYPMRR